MSLAQAPLERCTKQGFDEIVRDNDDFWEAGRTPRLLHPMFVFEFGDTAFVIRDGERVAAYLFGVLATASPTAYVHLVAVRHAHRGQGLGRRLYEHFLEVGRSRGARRAKAITSPHNAASIAFHERLGFHAVGDGEGTTPVVRDYSGPGVDRVVLVRDLTVGV